MRDCDSLEKWCLSWPWLASHATVDGSSVPRLSWGSRGAGMSGANDARLPSLIIALETPTTSPTTWTWTPTRTPSWYHTSSYAALVAGIIVAVSRRRVHYRMGELLATKMLVCLTRRWAGDRQVRHAKAAPATHSLGRKQTAPSLSVWLAWMQGMRQPAPPWRRNGPGQCKAAPSTIKNVLQCRKLPMQGQQKRQQQQQQRDYIHHSFSQGDNQHHAHHQPAAQLVSHLGPDKIVYCRHITTTIRTSIVRRLSAHLFPHRERDHAASSIGILGIARCHNHFGKSVARALQNHARHGPFSTRARHRVFRP